MTFISALLHFKPVKINSLPLPASTNACSQTNIKMHCNQAERAAQSARYCTYESMRIADPSFPFGFGGIYFDFVNF